MHVAVDDDDDELVVTVGAAVVVFADSVLLASPEHLVL